MQLPPNSCRYKRDAVVLEPSQSGVKEVTAYGIASVYTPEQNRRRGYAQHMMRLVHWVIANEAFRSSHPFPPAWGAAPTVPVGLGDGVFSVLYSDVGPKFYAGCGEADASGAGWQVSGPVSSIIPVISGSSITDDAGKWRILNPEECKAAWREDIGLMKKDVEHIAGNHAGHIIAAMLPTQGVAACQIFRTMDPTTGELPSQRWGVHLDESSSPSPTFATWGWELRATPKSMVVTRLRAPDVPHFQNLLQQLVRTAADAAVEQVEIWNVPEEFRASVATAGGKTFERDDHLPSIKYYDSSADAERVHFAFNEK
jgi:hypothetical protein